MSAWEILAGAAVGVALTEFTELSPWLARKLVRYAAHRWTPDVEQAEIYAEAWTAVINDRPGKLFKLLTAIGFTFGAVRRASARRATKLRTMVSQMVRTQGQAVSRKMSPARQYFRVVRVRMLDRASAKMFARAFAKQHASRTRLEMMWRSMSEVDLLVIKESHSHGDPEPQPPTSDRSAPRIR